VPNESDETRIRALYSDCKPLRSLRSASLCAIAKPPFANPSDGSQMSTLHVKRLSQHAPHACTLGGSQTWDCFAKRKYSPAIAIDGAGAKLRMGKSESNVQDAGKLRWREAGPPSPSD
jgi:hypothetical protein